MKQGLKIYETTIIVAVSVGLGLCNNPRQPGVGSAAEVAELAAESDSSQEVDVASGWRRTAKGWENATNWPVPAHRPADPPAIHLHPGLLAALILLLSIGGLIGFDPQHDQPSSLTAD